MIKYQHDILAGRRRFVMPTVSHEELKSIVKESVKEALEEELIKVRLMYFPEVSDKEMSDIAVRYGKPDSETGTVFVDIVDFRGSVYR
jgi:hypothetical protein